MVERKYLKFLLSCILLHISTGASASAWLPNSQKYKITFSYAQIDHKSEKDQLKRIEMYRSVDESITKLVDLKRKLYLKRDYELSIIEARRYSNSEDKKQDLQLVSFVFEMKIENVNNIIKKKIELLKILASYQDKSRAKAAIEYGIVDNLSLGIASSSNKNQFLKSEYTKAESNANDAEIFMKLKLFQNDQYIISMQPKFITEKIDGSKEQNYAEFSLLTGKTYKGRLGEVFIEFWAGFGRCMRHSCIDKRYSHYSVSEGYKMPLGLMITNFTRYYLRKSYGEIHSRTIYNQLSLARETKFGKCRQNKLTSQIGYFTDQSTISGIGKYYKVSGLMFSMWLDV